MKYYAVIKDDGGVIALGDTPISMEGFQTVSVDIEDMDFDKIAGYTYTEGTLVFSEDKWREAQKQAELDTLRSRRDMECFSIVNRGSSWYDMYVNTDERKAEFEQWYQAWLDVTKTLVIPDKPDWVY